jgi:hypothetical protein
MTKPAYGDPKAPISVDQRAAWQADTTLPAALRDALLQGRLVDPLAIDSEGNFWHQGELLTDERLLDLFARSVVCSAGGTYLVEVPPFSYPLVVHDVAVFVRTVSAEADGLPGTGKALWLELSSGRREMLRLDTLRYVPGRGFYCRVHEGTLWARCGRTAYFALAELVEETTAGVVLTWEGRRVLIPTSTRENLSASV